MLITGESEALGARGLMWNRQAGRETEYSVINGIRAVWTGYYQSRGGEGTESHRRADRFLLYSCENQMRYVCAIGYKW